MLESSFTIGRVAGIRIGVHYTWFIIFALLTLSLTLLFQIAHPEWTQAQTTWTAVITALLFFLSIVLHELGHSLVALRKGIPVRSITLFIFGGVAQTERDTQSAAGEFWIAIAGPIVSLALAGLFFLLSLALQGVSDPAAVAFGWLAFINLVVALFKEGLNKSILDFSDHAKRKAWFPLCFVINGLQPLITAAHPCAAGSSE